MANGNLERFLVSLDGASPPEGLAPPARAVWHGLRGEWERAHAIVQALESADAAWVHAWLHRVEGDLGNARYWYRRAGRSVARGATESEGQAKARRSPRRCSAVAEQTARRNGFLGCCSLSARNARARKPSELASPGSAGSASGGTR
jgi:hypothetical protein